MNFRVRRDFARFVDFSEMALSFLGAFDRDGGLGKSRK